MDAHQSSLLWKDLLLRAHQERATDIHFSNQKVYLRIQMALQQIMDLQRHYEPVLRFFMNQAQHSALEDHGEVDFAAAHEGYRLRCNVYKTAKGLCGAFRPLPQKTFPWKEIGIPAQILELTTKSPQGLVLVTGPTGSGKSTTLCSLIEHINQTRAVKILTIEDPIEYMFEDKQAVIDQREVGTHTRSFQEALRVGMRQNPNVIFIGEIRDYETALTALHAAETGHLVFATLHTKRVSNTVTRIVEMAPPEMQGEIRAAIANNVICVICQRLLPRADSRGIVACREIMVMTPAIANHIKERKEKSIPSIMNANRGCGMIDWDNALQELLRQGQISAQTASAQVDTHEKINV